MTNVLSAESLMPYVQALAGDIGPRPAGHTEEMRARQRVRQFLNDLDYYDIETLPFPSPDTWGYALAYPLGLALASNMLGRNHRSARLVGGAAALASGYALWEAMRIGKQPFTALATRHQSATLIIRIPPVNTPHRKLVLLAHLDSNKDRPSFSPQFKKALLGLATAGLGAVLSNGVAQIAEALGTGKGAKKFRQASTLAIAISLLVSLIDEQGDYVPGANDNATAIACVLGLAAHLREQPLQHTEVWLAFTGAEEVGCLGTHALLDTYGHTLRNAWFLDFEMVGTEEITYVTRHTGFSLLSTYRPDPESLVWAETTAQRHPEFNIGGRELVIGEEVGALRLRGYRGLCLAGVGPDGWLANWHQSSDTVENIIPAGLEKAARFARAMMDELDRGIV